MVLKLTFKLSNEKIKYYFSLKRKKNRLNEKKIVLEGERLVYQVLQTKNYIDTIILNEEDKLSKTKNKILKLAKTKSIPLFIVDTNIIDKLSSTKNNQSIIAISNLPSYDKTNYKDNILALDRISDPGNFGTLLRSAEWFGINNILLSENCVDQYNPKVIRSAMGSQFNIKSIKIVKLDYELNKIKKLNYSILGADKIGETISNINFNKKWILIIGNEANGLSDAVKPYITDLITIPGKGNVESLNAAVAGSILLNELSK
ncbi:MAG: hypothetical protein CMF80_03715 [Candidatus Marinimicrobia bacterium]|nr:hypothetical protein [Candidatus Neomarinimicrobiota bacterium]